MTHCPALAAFLHAIKLSSLLLLFTAALTCTESAARELIPFDSDWRFHLGDETDAKQVGFDDSSWRTLDLPHDWSIEGPLNPPPEGEGNSGFFIHGIAWYRKSFSLPGITGKKVVVEFDGVYMNSEVWINGQFLGRRPNGFIGFRYDITQFLKTDGTPNVLAVRVDDSLEPSLRSYAGSGIYRHVRLVTTEFTHFRLNGGITITTPEVKPAQAIVEARYIVDSHFLSCAEQEEWARDVWNAHPVSKMLVLRSAVLSAEGYAIANSETKFSVESMHSGYELSQRLAVTKPHLWSDKTPALYRLRSTLLLDGCVLDEVTTPFGIRRLEFVPDKGMFVNGRATKLKGVCLHQDVGSFGNAVPMEVWAWRLAQLKEVGCNAIRPSHHPFAPEFYDLCDQLGFYVFDEAFDEWTRDWPYNYTENTRGKSKYGYHLYFEQWGETDLRDMLRRDRNHPCVVLYSIGNEIPNQFDAEGWKIAKKLISLCHREDPTRPATSACDQSSQASRNGFMDMLDIAGYNYIDRLYQEKTYAPEHERFPRRLFLGTETSFQVHNWLGVRDNAYVIGDFLWSGYDYLGEVKALPARGADTGFLDIAGGRKPEFYQRAAYWREDPVLQLTVLTGEASQDAWHPAPSSYKWNGTVGAQVQVRALTNCEEVELFLNKRSLGRHAVSRKEYFGDWAVPYESGILSAVGYRGGKQTVTKELRTTGAPTQLQVTQSQAPNTGDFSFYEITVVDKTGLQVTDASPLVTIKVEGAGRLVALDTGDLNHGGLFKTDTRKAHQGRLLAIVRRTESSGELRVSASAPDLLAGVAGAASAVRME